MLGNPRAQASGNAHTLQYNERTERRYYHSLANEIITRLDVVSQTIDSVVRRAEQNTNRQRKDPPPRFHRLTKKGLRRRQEAILVRGMIRGGFLEPNIRSDLIALVRDGKAETRLTRGANALLLLDDGMSCTASAKVLYLDDDTIGYWYQLYGEKGLNWLADFGYKGRACEFTAAQ